MGRKFNKNSYTMKNILSILFLVIFFTSCNSIKFKENPYFEDDYLVIHGKVKSITSISLPTKQSKDTIKYFTEYNKNNLPIKQIAYYKNGPITSTLTYDKKNNLISIFFDGKHKSSTLYEYDKKGNVLNSKSYDNDVLSVENKFTYDYKNNKIQEIHIGRDRPGDTTSFRNNYIKRTCTSYSLNSKGGSKTFYDKKGKEIKSETKYGILLYEYDKMDRVSKKTSLDTNGKMKFENNYKNTYDKKKNLVETIIQDNNGYYSRIIYKIDYHSN